jgi:hypothetical protein
MHLQVYIDTNVYLQLLATQATSSDSLTKFRAMCASGSVEVLLPKHVEDEYASNREDVIARALQGLKSAKSLGSFPSLAETHSAAANIRKLRRELASEFETIIAWYESAARSHTLPADELLADLRNVGRVLPVDEAILDRARQRADVHRPPGKGSALGDRIIWECLLQASEIFCDLHLITADKKDFASPFDPTTVRKPLSDEWYEQNLGAAVHLYGSIDDFLDRGSKLDEFSRATEIGRAIWTLGNASEDEAIDAACEIFARYLRQFSVLQAKLIARNARSYYERVFITTDQFDGFIFEFWTLYAKHLDEKNAHFLAQVLAASGMIAQQPAKAANAN